MGKKQAARQQKQHKRGGKEEAPPAEAAAAAERPAKGKQQRRKGRHEVSLWDGDGLERELAAIGLRIKTMEADGNCWFRAVCDQLEGEGGDHFGLRQRVVAFIEANEDDYKFFIEDDEPWDAYIRRMKKDGAWAGHLELQATSMLLWRNLCVYQAGQPVWRIQNFPDAAEPPLHLSYHDGMHYNSVRNDDDFGTGPPEPLCVRSASAGGGAPAGGPGAARAFGGAEVDQVVAGTGCLDRQRIAAALERCGGDVDQAIELLIEQLGQEGEEEPAGGGGGEAPAPQQQQEAADAAAPGSGSGSSSADAAGKPQAAAAAAAIAAPAGQQPSDDAIRLELRLQPGNPGRVALVLHCSGQQGAAAEAAAAEAAAEGGDEGPADSAAGSAAGPAGAAGSKKKKEKKEKGVRLKHKLDHPARNQRCPCGSGKKHKSCCAHRKGGPPAAAAAAEEAAAEAVAQQLRVLDI